METQGIYIEKKRKPFQVQNLKYIADFESASTRISHRKEMKNQQNMRDLIEDNEMIETKKQWSRNKARIESASVRKTESSTNSKFSEVDYYGLKKLIKPRPITAKES